MHRPDKRRRYVSLALLVACTLGAASLTNGSRGFLPAWTVPQDDASPEMQNLAQLGADETGSIDSFEIRKDPPQTDWSLKLDESFLVLASAADSMAWNPDGSAAVGQCTNGEASDSFGGCAYGETSLRDQLGYGMTQFRSLGFASNGAQSGAPTVADPSPSLVTASIGRSPPTRGASLNGSGKGSDATGDDRTNDDQDDYDDFNPVASDPIAVNPIANAPVAVPEPATISLLGIGLLALAATRRRRAPN